MVINFVADGEVGELEKFYTGEIHKYQVYKKEVVRRRNRSDVKNTPSEPQKIES